MGQYGKPFQPPGSRTEIKISSQSRRIKDQKDQKKKETKIKKVRPKLPRRRRLPARRRGARRCRRAAQARAAGGRVVGSPLGNRSHQYGVRFRKSVGDKH